MRVKHYYAGQTLLCGSNIITWVKHYYVGQTLLCGSNIIMWVKHYFVGQIFCALVCVPHLERAAKCAFCFTKCAVVKHYYAGQTLLRGSNIIMWVKYFVHFALLNAL